MVLTKEEQQELETLRAELSPQVASQQPINQQNVGGLTPEESAELLQLRSELGIEAIAPEQEDKGFIQSAAEGVADLSKSFAAGLGELPLGATQIVTDVISGVSQPKEGRAVAEIFQKRLNEETQKLMGEGLDFQSALEQARGNIRDLGIADPSETNIEDVRRAQASAAGTLESAQQEAMDRSPIAATVGDIAAKAGQLAPVAGGSMVRGGATFLGLENLLKANDEVKTASEALQDRAVAGIKGTAIGAAGGKVLGTAGKIIGTATPLILRKAGEAGSSLAGKSKDVIRNSVNKLIGVSPQAARDALDTGIVSSVAQLSDRASIKLLDRTLSKIPFASDVLSNKAVQVVDDIERGLSKVVRAKPESLQEVGFVFQKGAEKFVNRFKNTSSKLYDRFYNKMPAETTFTIDNTKKLLNDTLGGLKSSPSLARNMSATKSFRSLQGVVDDAAHNGGNLPFNVMRRWRSVIGEKLSSPAVLAGEDVTLLKKLYSSLSEDMKIAAKSAGDDAFNAFNKANDIYSFGAKRIENSLQKIINSKEPEKIMQFALQGTKQGGTRIKNIMRSLDGNDRDIVRSTFLNNLGRKTPDEAFSINRFVTSWDVMSREAKEALFGSKSSMIRSIDSLSKVAAKLKDIDRFSNPSGTAQTIFTGASLGALYLAPLQTAAGLTAANISARLMTNRGFVTWLAKNATKNRITKSGVTNSLKELENVALKNPAIADDIYQYINMSFLSAGNRVSSGVKNGN